MKTLDVLGEELVEDFGGFVLEDKAPGEHAVANGVAGRAEFAGIGDGPFGEAAVEGGR